MLSLVLLVVYYYFRRALATMDLVDLATRQDMDVQGKVDYLIKTLLTPESSSLYLGDSELIRRAENPFRFLHGIEKIFSYAYLHFRYCSLLLLPWQLCAE